MGVTGRGLHLENTVGDLEDRDVKGATTEVKDQDGLLGWTLVETVSQGGGRGLVHDAQHFETGDLTGFLGGGALGVVEVGRHGNNGLGDGLAEVGLGVTLELHQHAGRDLLRGVLGSVNVDGPAGAHVTLDGTNGAVRVRDGLTLRDFTDQDFAGLGEADDRRGCAATL